MLQFFLLCYLRGIWSCLGDTPLVFGRMCTLKLDREGKTLNMGCKIPCNRGPILDWKVKRRKKVKPCICFCMTPKTHQCENTPALQLPTILVTKPLCHDGFYHPTVNQNKSSYRAFHKVFGCSDKRSK